MQLSEFRSSPQEALLYICIEVLKYFAKFKGKHLCWSLVLNKVAACNVNKKETPARVFSCEFYEIFKKTYSVEKNLRTAAPLNSPCGFRLSCMLIDAECGE